MTLQKQLLSSAFTFVAFWNASLCLQLFRERLSEKVHTTIPKGIVGGFDCTVLQRNLKQCHGRPRTFVCECWTKVTKVGSTTTVVRNNVLIISHITLQDCRMHIFSTTFLEIVVCPLWSQGLLYEWRVRQVSNNERISCKTTIIITNLKEMLKQRDIIVWYGEKRWWACWLLLLAYRQILKVQY